MIKENITILIVAITYLIGLLLVLWYFIGNSPSLEQVIIGLLIINLGWTYKLSVDFSYHMGEHSGQKKER